MPASKAQRAATAERRSKAVAMRIAGIDYETIAERLGYAGRAAAYVDINRALEANVAEQNRNVEVMRQEELLRLDRLMAEAWAVLRRSHVSVSHGRIVRDEQGQPIKDDAPTLSAIDRILKIQERKAKFLGLDAPQRHEVVTLDAVDAEIRRLTEELGRGETGTVAGATEAAGTSTTTS